MPTLALSFPESRLDRANARRACNAFLRQHCQASRNHWLIFATMIGEMVVNIFDHAGGSGGVTIDQDDTTLAITFKVWDCGQGFDWDASKGQSRLDGNGVNFGAGLIYVERLGPRFNCQRIIQPTGTEYRGTFTWAEADQWWEDHKNDK